MALFGLGSKKETTTMAKVRPTVVRTQNVAKEIFKIAKSYDIAPELLDFNILGVQSYTRLNSKEKESEWEEVDNEALHTLDESQLLNAYFEIKQTYEIEIFSKNLQGSDPCKEMLTAIGANATKCKVYLSVKAGSKVDYFPRFRIEFEEMIQKKKVRAGILVHVFDEMLSEVVSKVSARLKVANSLTFDKTETFLVAQGYEPTVTTNDDLILHFEKKEELDEHTKADYASRGYIQSVKEGDVLIEYIKPKEGKPGRNCRGEYIKPQEPKISHEPTFTVNETIKVVDTPESIKYIAKENGYIAFENNMYLIKNELDVGEVSFKTTGSILSGINSDINMSVKESNAIKDAVGTGMTVEVSELEVDGNVGSNAKVLAKRVSIGGQTHKTAYIEADEMNINVHKGKAKGKHIHITRLEHGEVEGENVTIAQALGGTIKAQEIAIEVCGSHVKATASQRIEIQKMHGSENTFTIDVLLQDDVNDGVSQNEKKIQKLEAELKELKKQVEKATTTLQEGQGAFLDLKKRLMHYKKSGVKMPASFVKKYKKFQEMQENLKYLKRQQREKTQQLNNLSLDITKLQKNILEARVINKDKWVGYNEIKFRLIEPPTELVYKPQEGSTEKIFGLVEVDENEYAIQALKE